MFIRINAECKASRAHVLLFLSELVVWYQSKHRNWRLVIGILNGLTQVRDFYALGIPKKPESPMLEQRTRMVEFQSREIALAL